MTNNEQKAKRIVDSIFSTGLNTYRTFYEMAYNSAMEMAEWKDRQFKEIVENYIKLAYDSGQEANLLEDLLQEL